MTKLPNAPRRAIICTFVGFALSVSGLSCGSLDLDEAGGEPDSDNPSWTEESHEKRDDPDYEVTFPDTRVLRFDVSIEPDVWAAMLGDLDENLSASGPGRGDDGGPGGGALPPDSAAAGGEMPGAEGEDDYTPMWGEATLEFDGAEWHHIGIRFKGGSTLRTASQAADPKYPFKLDFDEWEDSYPEVKNQRFFGFRQLNLSTSREDETFMREKLTADLFRAAGVPSAHVAFCEVYLDVGDGPESAGLYSLVEEVDDTVHEQQFSTPDGNLYKPEGSGASFAAGTYNQGHMYPKTNEEETDYSDVLALYDALHATERETDPETWQAGLESTFDVESFLEYLAVNQVIQNWDTYGRATHNYFIYADQGTLHWIPWDFNESLNEGSMFSALSLGLDEVEDDWPLIRFVIDVPEYRQAYETLVSEFVSGAFAEARLGQTISDYQELLAPYASEETAGFDSAVSTLRAHVSARHAAVENFL